MFCFTYSNTNYRSHFLIDDTLEVLAVVVEEPILKAMQASVATGLEADESTDVAIRRQLDLHVRY